MKIIGIGHKSRQGKDTLGKFLVQEFAKGDYYAKTYSFADSLKSYCRVAFGMEEKDGNLLQYVGTEIFRKKDADFWVKQLFLKLEEEQPEIAIVTDMRFLNEANFIRNLGGVTVDVIRLNKDDSRYLDETRDANHRSEIELDDYDFDITFQNLMKYDGRDLDTAMRSVYSLIKNYFDLPSSYKYSHRRQRMQE